MSAMPSAPLPSPTALRLVCLSRGTRVSPPLGLAAWSEDERADLALLLDGPRAGPTPTLPETAAQIPDPGSLRSGTLLVVLGDLPPGRALLGRWLGPRAHVPRAVRCSALLALGYERLGGGVDPRSGQDLAWGYVRARQAEAGAPDHA
jgi:hypothetical protein